MGGLLCINYTLVFVFSLFFLKISINFLIDYILADPMYANGDVWAGLDMKSIIYIAALVADY